MVKTLLSMQEAQVQSWVREQRSHNTAWHSKKKKKKKILALEWNVEILFPRVCVCPAESPQTSSNFRLNVCAQRGLSDSHRT